MGEVALAVSPEREGVVALPDLPAAGGGVVEAMAFAETAGFLALSMTIRLSVCSFNRKKMVNWGGWRGNRYVPSR